jgi:DNA-binding transcriptional LysR family regulator
MGIDPTFQQLRVFLAVAEELHFGRAAARMHMAQPPVTRHVRALESAVGTPLFDRSGRTVRLTPAGVLLRREAQAILDRWNQAARRATDVARSRERSLTLGCVEAMAVDALPRAIVRLRALRPDVSWELREGHTPELLAGLASERYDCVVVRGPIPAGEEVDSVVVHNDELVAALPEDHRLTDGEIPLSALAAEDFIVYERRVDHGLLPAIVSVCAQAGFVPRIRYEALGTPLVLGLVAAGDGVALVSAAVARGPHRGVRFARISTPRAVSPILLAWRRGIPGELAHQLADLLHRAAGDAGDVGDVRDALGADGVEGGGSGGA